MPSVSTYETDEFGPAAMSPSLAGFWGERSLRSDLAAKISEPRQDNIPVRLSRTDDELPCFVVRVHRRPFERRAEIDSENRFNLRADSIHIDYTIGGAITSPRATAQTVKTANKPAFGRSLQWLKNTLNTVCGFGIPNTGN
jgi:hypothetical protein